MIEKIKKYQEFFDKFEQRRKYDRKYAKQMKQKGRGGGMGGGGPDDDFELTIEDVKLGRKLAQIDQFNKKNFNIKEAKLDYYKNMKPHKANFKIQVMDPNQEII